LKSFKDNSKKSLKLLLRSKGHCQHRASWIRIDLLGKS